VAKLGDEASTAQDAIIFLQRVLWFTTMGFAIAMIVRMSMLYKRSQPKAKIAARRLFDMTMLLSLIPPAIVTLLSFISPELLIRLSISKTDPHSHAARHLLKDKGLLRIASPFYICDAARNTCYGSLFGRSSAYVDNQQNVDDPEESISIFSTDTVFWPAIINTTASWFGLGLGWVLSNIMEERIVGYNTGMTLSAIPATAALLLYWHIKSWPDRCARYSLLDYVKGFIFMRPDAGEKRPLLITCDNRTITSPPITLAYGLNHV